MARVFSITAAATSLRVDAQGRAEASFTVSNTSGRPLKGRAEVRATDPSQQAWLSIAGEAERNFAAGGTGQVSVKVSVRPGTPPGKCSFRLDVVSVENPDEDFAEGPTVTMEVGTLAPPKKKFSWWIIAVAAVVLIIAGGATYYFTRETGVEVPDVKGLKVAEAAKRLQAAALRAGTETKKLTEGAESGAILSQDPAAGKRLKEGSAVNFDVAEAAVKIPSVVGKRRDEAESILKQARLRIGGPFLREASSGAQDNIVQDQKPAAGDLAAVNSPVDLFIAVLIIKGSEVPSVVGLSRPDADAKLRAAGLVPGRISPKASLANPGMVMEQYPKPLAGVVVPQGSPVDLVVADPPRVPPAVPVDFAGRIITYRGVSLNGTPSNTARVAPNSPVRISFAYNITAPPRPNYYCPGCIVQFYVGIDRAKGGFSKCLMTSGMPAGFARAGNMDFVFRAPTSKGLYYVTNGATFEMGCREDRAQHNNDPNGALALIEVE